MTHSPSTNGTNNEYKVGDIADKTGLSVRTLHYYEEIGLFASSKHTEAGHRLYTNADIARLQQILSLRQLGFSLEEVKASLDKPEFSPQHILDMHLSRMEKELESHQELLEKMKGIKRLMDRKGLVSAEDFLNVIALMNKVESYFSPEEMAELKQRGKDLGPEKIQQVENRWPSLIAEVKQAMQGGTDPTDPKVQALAKEWKQLVEAFTGGNPEIAAKVKKMYQENPSATKTFGGPDPEMSAYIQKAMTGLKN